MSYDDHQASDDYARRMERAYPELVHNVQPQRTLEARVQDLDYQLQELTRTTRRTETRLCVLLEHLGAGHLIQPKNT